jgi:N-acetylmuramoyl-L-alanine amidase
MKINVHAGHNPDGMIACGAIGLIYESTEARYVKDYLIGLLRYEGHTVYDCTVNDGSSQSDVLAKIVRKCNAHTVDMDISIHFNSGANDNDGNNKTTGVEVYTYSSTSKLNPYGADICKRVASLGFSNRGVKYDKGLYVLRNTNAPALLVECCFVDDADDVALYNYQRMALAIASGILGKNLLEAKVTKKTLKLRKIPSAISIFNGTLYEGDKVSVHKIGKYFAKVKINDTTGWVYKKYLKFT